MIAAAALLCSLLAAPQGDGPARFAAESYSFTCPEGWVLASAETLADVKREVGMVPQLEDLDFDLVDALVFDPAPADFAATANFVVTPGDLPVDAAGARTLRGELTQRLRAMDVDFRSEVAVVATNVHGAPCFQVEYDAVLPGGDEVVRQRQLLVPLGGELLSITMSASKDAFPDAEPSFAAMLDTLQVVRSPGLISRLVDAWRSLPGFVRGAIFGSLLGGVGALVYVARRRRRGAPWPAAGGAE